MKTQLTTSSLRFSRKIFLLIIIGLSLVISGGIGAYYAFTAFQINHIEVVLSDPSVELIGLQDFYHKNILLLQSRDMETQLKDKNTLIKQVQITKQYPNTVTLTIKTYTPLAYIAVENGFLYISEDGHVLEKVRKVQGELPIIHFYQEFRFDEYKNGDVLSFEDIIVSLKLQKMLSDLGVKIDSIDISSFHMIACKGEGKTFVFSSTSDFDTQKYQVETIVKQFKIEGKDFVQLDVRFDKPVIEVKK